MKFKAIPPIPCINGSPLSRLCEQKLALLEALRTAYEALIFAEPHGRDWQIEGFGFDLTYDKARDEHTFRLLILGQLIEAVTEEHYVLYEAWREQQQRLKKQRESEGS